MKDTAFVNKLKRDIKRSYLVRYVDEEDVKNETLKDLPVRIGCLSMGGCAFLGTCREIISTVPREKYEQVINYEKTLPIDEFNKQIKEIYYKFRKE